MRDMDGNGEARAFLKFYETARSRLERGLDGWCAGRTADGNPLIQTGRERLFAMNAGGKRLRGTLAYLGCRLAGMEELSRADALAQAWELFQTAILVHDDIIDHAPLRRGIETIHSRYARDFAPVPGGAEAGASLALCLGDMGLFLAQQRMTEGYLRDPALGPLLAYFNEIVLRTIEGELLDVQLSFQERSAPDRDGSGLERSVYDIYHLKTACYTMIGPLCTGLLLGGASEETRRAAEEFADDLGVAFQLQDDILGVFGEPDKLGKGVGGDVAEFKQTALYAFVKTRGGAAWETLKRYYGTPELSPEELEDVRGVFRDCGALAYAEERAEALFDSASGRLEALGGVSEEGKTLLRGFMAYLRRREA